MERLQFGDAGSDDRRLGQGALERFDGLETVAGDAEDDLVVGAQPTALSERERGGQGDPAGRLGEHAGRFGEEPDARDPRRFRDAGGPAAAPPDGGRGEAPVGRVPDREGARDRLREHRLEHVAAALDQPHDRRAAVRLGAVQPR
jgi:hypothetical protein